MSKKKQKRIKSKKAFQVKLKPATIFSIAQVIFISLAMLTIISFSRRGTLLVSLNDALLEIFSWTTVLLPFIFIAFSLLLSKIKTPLNQPNVVVGAILLFISILSITRAGFAGHAAWEGMATLITGPGAFIVLA